MRKKKKKKKKMANGRHKDNLTVDTLAYGT
jgi:hypothetical protein